MIGIIIAGQLELSPYIKKYISVFEKNKTAYEIIHWNRSIDSCTEANGVYTYGEPVDRYAHLFKKLLPLLRFRRYAEKIIKERQYEKLVVLTTQTAVLLSPLLLGRCKHKYFFDYRDASYEYIAPYRWLVNRIIKCSCGVCISSPGFAKYLTDKKPLLIAHNFQDEYYRERSLVCKKKGLGEKIVMGYIGVLREYDYLAKLASHFGEDSRFEFCIHGSGDDLEKLRNYCEKYPNVHVFGAYDEKDKREIISSFDMICYNYPNSYVNYPAVANKFYDALIMKKPMFCNSRTFSGQLTASEGLGISLDELDTDITSKLYDYYIAFSAEEFAEKCEKYLCRVTDEDMAYATAIERLTEQ